MTLDDQAEPPPCRADLVPQFSGLTAKMRVQAERLTWVPHGTRRKVGGVATQGGFYLQPPNGIQFSFAIDESLPVGRPESARPPRLLSGHCIGYHQLDPHQRAVYLRSLANRELPADIPLAFCARLQIATLEWGLIVDRVTPEEIISDLLHVIAPFDGADRIPLLTLLQWCAYFQGPAIHLAVLEGMLENGWQTPNGSLLRLALSDCASTQRPIWPQLALLLYNFCATWSAYDRQYMEFQGRFLERFKVLYPNGLAVTTGLHRVQAEYRFYCPELRAARCVIEVRDAIEGTPLRAALEEVARPIITGPELDPAKLQRLKEDTLRTQQFLEARMEKAPEQPCTPTRTEREGAQQLDKRSLGVLRELTQRPEWPATEFEALARAHKILPLALAENLNNWAISNFGETLLVGENPAAVNQNLITNIQKHSYANH